MVKQLKMQVLRFRDIVRGFIEPKLFIQCQLGKVKGAVTYESRSAFG